MRVEVKDSKTRRFLIECNFAENQHVRSLPNRRFIRRTKAWEAPALRRNIACLRKLQEKGIAELSPEADKLCAEVEELVAASKKHVPFPTWYPFKTDPYKVQQHGLDFMWSTRNPALFCEMGTGKSKMMIDWLSAKIMAGEAKAAVVFCPTSIRDNWVEQVEIHCPIEGVEARVVQAQTKAQRRVLYEFMDDPDIPAKILICGIESLQQKVGGGTAYGAVLHFITREHHKPYLCLVDESHLIQNVDTNRWQNISKLSMAAASRVVATGTETDGNPLDLYGQFEFLDENILGFGNYYSFKNRYAVMGGYENREVVSYQNLDELIEIVRPHVFQATKEDVTDLPDKIHLPPRVAVVEGVLAVYTAIQQVCCGHMGHAIEVETKRGPKMQRTQTRVVEPKNNPKIRELLQILPEVRGKCLIWCKYRLELGGVVEALSKEYGPGSVLQFHGDMDRDERAEAIDRFRNDPDARFFVLMSSVGGTGLTLNEATFSIYMSNSFKLRDRLQSEDRNHRIGQGSPVRYIDIVADHPVERLINSAIRDKKDVADFLRKQIRDGKKPGDLL